MRRAASGCRVPGGCLGPPIVISGYYPKLVPVIGSNFNVSRRKKGRGMAENVYKKIELVGTSPNSFSEATANAIARATQTVKHMSWFEVAEQRGAIADGKIKEYQVTIRIGFRVE
jgi:flavin-binding protein dodecin